MRDAQNIRGRILRRAATCAGCTSLLTSLPVWFVPTLRGSGRIDPDYWEALLSNGNIVPFFRLFLTELAITLLLFGLTAAFTRRFLSGFTEDATENSEALRRKYSFVPVLFLGLCQVVLYLIDTWPAERRGAVGGLLMVRHAVLFYVRTAWFGRVESPAERPGKPS